MFRAVGLVGKRFSAEPASEWPRPCVDIHVLMQSVFHCEPLVAHTANVGLGRVSRVVDQDVLLHGVLFYLLSTIVAGEYGVLV